MKYSFDLFQPLNKPLQSKNILDLMMVIRVVITMIIFGRTG